MAEVFGRNINAISKASEMPIVDGSPVHMRSIEDLFVLFLENTDI